MPTGQKNLYVEQRKVIQSAYPFILIYYWFVEFIMC